MGFCKTANIGSVLVLSGLAKLGQSDDAIRKVNPTFILEKFSNSE